MKKAQSSKRTNNKSSNNTLPNSNDLIKVKSTTDTKKASNQKKVNQLWQQIREQKQQLADYDKHMSESLALYQSTIVPAEKQYLLAPQIALTERLMTLFERKTLSDWQRDIMVSWISRMQERVEELDTQQGQLLQQKMLTLVEKVASYKLNDQQKAEMQQDMQAEFERIAEEVLGEKVEAPEGGWDFAKFTEFMQQRQAEQFQESLEGNLHDAVADEDDFFSQFTQHKKSTPQKNSEAFETWLNQMFRRTAKVLHPDKQMDDSVREQNEADMARLAHAKDHQDIATIIELYMTHVGDSQLDDMQALDEKHLINALQQQLESLKQEYHLAQHKNPLTDYAMNRLKKVAKDPKEKDKWLKEIQAEAKECEATTKDLKNLTELKKILEQMWEEEREQDLRMRAMMFEQMFGEGFDFDED